MFLWGTGVHLFMEMRNNGLNMRGMGNIGNQTFDFKCTRTGGDGGGE